MLEQKTLFWLFIGIFAITAIITLLGITGVIKTIKEKYLNSLFTALIMEVVAAIVLMFQTLNLPSENLQLSDLLKEAGLEVPADVSQQKKVLFSHLKAGITLPKVTEEKEQLMATIAQKEEALANCTGHLGDKESRFYQDILRLNALTKTYLGGNINLGFEPEKKEEAYQLLVSIFNELGEIRDGDAIYLADKTINKEVVRELYAKFRETYGRPVEAFDNIYLDKFDVSQMVKIYLERK